MKIEFSKHCDKYKFLNNEVSIVYQNELYSGQEGDEETLTTLLEIKLLNKECFAEGIFFCEVSTIYFEPDWIRIYESDRDRGNDIEERLDLGLEIKEDDEDRYKNGYFIEKDRKIENAFGYYSFPTPDQLERNEKELKEIEDAYIDWYEESSDEYHEADIVVYLPTKQNPFLGNEILERNFLDKTSNDDLLKFSNFKVHLDVALSNVNLQLKQAILDGLHIKEIGDTQKFIKKIKDVYEPLFIKSFEIKEKEKLDKENLIKKLLNEFGLD